MPLLEIAFKVKKKKKKKRKSELCRLPEHRRTSLGGFIEDEGGRRVRRKGGEGEREERWGEVVAGDGQGA